MVCACCSAAVDAAHWLRTVDQTWSAQSPTLTLCVQSGPLRVPAPCPCDRAERDKKTSRNQNRAFKARKEQFLTPVYTAIQLQSLAAGIVSPSVRRLEFAASAQLPGCPCQADGTVAGCGRRRPVARRGLPVRPVVADRPGTGPTAKPQWHGQWRHITPRGARKP